MPSSLPNSAERPPLSEEWARLIPGQITVLRSGSKKPSHGVRTHSQAAIAQMAPLHNAENRIGLWSLLPAPFQGRNAWMWFRAVAADFALVILNWLVIGALLVPLRSAFPGVRLFSYAAGSPLSLVGIALLHASVITLMAYIERLYSAEKSGRNTLDLGKSILWATVLLSLTYGLQGTHWTRTLLFTAAGLLNLLTLSLWRRYRFVQGSEKKNAHLRHTLIVGASSLGKRLAARLDSGGEDSRFVCGFLDDRRPLGGDVIGRVGDLPRLARTLFVDEVILAAPQDRNLILQVLHQAQRLRLDVEIVPELYGCYPASSDIETAGDLPLIWLHVERLPATALVIKRLVDVVGAGLALIASSPVLAVIAALIKIDSPGPVLYCAERAGRKAQPFRCYKFRTMVSDADKLKDDLRSRNQRSGPFFKIADDPRITRVGRFLRRFSLDELPQFWNVLKGDMSLVGPRPHPLDDFASYETEHLARLDVTPGITGLWQVTARRNPSFERGMELDREYIQRWSLRLDAQILLQTLLTVMRGDGD